MQFFIILGIILFISLIKFYSFPVSENTAKPTVLSYFEIYRLFSILNSQVEFPTKRCDLNDAEAKKLQQISHLCAALLAVQVKVMQIILAQNIMNKS